MLASWGKTGFAIDPFKYIAPAVSKKALGAEFMTESAVLLRGVSMPASVWPNVELDWLLVEDEFDACNPAMSLDRSNAIAIEENIAIMPSINAADDIILRLRRVRSYFCTVSFFDSFAEGIGIHH